VKRNAPNKTRVNLLCLAVANVVVSPAFKSTVRLPTIHTGVAWSVSVSALLQVLLFSFKRGYYHTSCIIDNLLKEWAICQQFSK
jgi:hypothetical protein